MLEKAITLLFLSGDPLSYVTLAELLGCKEEEIISNVPVLTSSLESIGLTLVVTKTDIAITTKGVYAPLVESFTKKEREGDLSPATLQVLTLVAYLGEATGEQISYIRGVQSSQSLRTLLLRGLITRTKDIYTLTGEALAHLGVSKKEDLNEYTRLHDQFLEKLQHVENV